jgi:glyoxylase-like metal-dependent hydrolase (beta-lactamase superfamily II)
MLRAIAHGDVLQLHGSTRVSRLIDYAVSAYVVRGVMIDTSFPYLRSELDAWLAHNRVEGALLTHRHEDHAGNIALLTARGIPVGMAAETLTSVRSPRPIGMYRRVTWGSAAPLPRDPTPFAHPALTLLPTPGHTSDHHAVWDAERETLFCGDLFIGVKVRIAHPREDVRGVVRSLRAMAALKPKRVFDAHRGPLADPVASLTAKADWMEDMFGRIESHADRGWSASRIRDAVLGREDLTGWASAGDYSRLNFVESVLSSRGAHQSVPGSTAGPPRE